MKRLIAIFALAMSVAALATPALAAPPVAGLARAKDGDSLMVGTQEVRLFGVDAPEFDQSCKRNGAAYSCGAEAADRLSRLVTGKQVHCTSMGTDQHDRVLGRCSVGALDVNRAMVAGGHAVAYRRYSTDYVSAEETAKANRRGIWAGTFEMPSDYRHEGATQSPARTQASRAPVRRAPQVGRARGQAMSGKCVIKGNRGVNGWIYHVPGMPYYGPTRAEEIFCSEAAARAAGYRRAIVR